MKLRTRGDLSAKKRYSTNGPGLWTQQPQDNAPTPEPRKRSIANSLSPQPKSKGKRERGIEVVNMRSKRTRVSTSNTDVTTCANGNQEQDTMEIDQSQNHKENKRASNDQNNHSSSEPGTPNRESSSSADDENDTRYFFGTQRNEPTFLDRISVLPEMREIPWRDGQALPVKRSSESSRVQQRGACLVATRGRVVQKPCTHCESGYGRFSHCIVLDEWFQGACATCIFTSKGNKCSLRVQHLGDQDARALRYTNTESTTKRKRSESDKRLSADENSLFHRFNSPGHYVSPYPPLPSIPRPPLRTPGLREAQEAELDSLLQAQIAREELDQGNVETGEPVTNDQLLRATPAVVPRPRFYPPPPNRQPAQQMQPIPPVQNPRNSISVGSPQVTERSLIGETSRTTQKQLFTVLSGVQGGLRQLQKELNQLKTIIGWDPEDEDQDVNRGEQSSSHQNPRPGP